LCKALQRACHRAHRRYRYEFVDGSFRPRKSGRARNCQTGRTQSADPKFDNGFRDLNDCQICSSGSRPAKHQHAAAAAIKNSNADARARRPSARTDAGENANT
jgi:hypothetical protein